MYTKEQIIDEIKRIARKIGVKSLKQKDFEINSTIPMSTLRFYLGSWNQALKEAGLESTEVTKIKDKADDDELLLDLIRIYKETGETPTLALIKDKGMYSERLYITRWKSVSDAFLVARKKFSHKFATPAGTILDEDEDLGVQRIDEVLDHERTGEIKKDVVKGDEAVDFSDLLMDRVSVSDEDKGKKAKDESENEQMDPNEITVVQTVEQVSLTGVPKEKKKGQSVFAEPIDFSDLGLDRPDSGSKKGEEAEAQLLERDKTIRVERKTGESLEEQIDLRTVEFRHPEPDEVIGKRGIKYIPQTIKPTKDRKRRSFVGELLNFRGLRFAPLNQQGVIFLFGMICHDLGFLIESIRPGFPLVEGKRCVDKENNHWEQVRIEVEYKSSYFREKGHDDNECDLIVCWSHDWEDCPIEVLELRSTINYLDSQKII